MVTVPKVTLLLSVASVVLAGVNDVQAPATIAAGSSVPISFSGGDATAQYRIYLAASLTGVNGPSCYLVNSTTIESPVPVSIPADVGPSANYYSIAIAEVATGQNPAYSNHFTFTGGTGNITQYEKKLGGAPFWNANDLPCASFNCARACADKYYPQDLTENDAYQNMVQCMLQCQSVTNSEVDRSPPHGDSVQSSSMLGGEVAAVTLPGGQVLTAVETVITSGSAVMTEAILGSGLPTLTLGAAGATVSAELVSLLPSGLDLGGSTTIPFSAITQAPASSNGQATTSSSHGAAPTVARFHLAGGIAGVMVAAAIVAI